MRPDLDALEALDAIVCHGGFAGAAAHLHKVQSAVNYQVRKLERQLGIALLDRTGYRVRLTPAGEAVLAEGRQVLAHAGRVASIAQQFLVGFEPRLTVVMDGMLAIAPLLAAVQRLGEECVPTRIRVKVEFLGGVQFRFDKDLADLMLVKDYAPRAELHAVAMPELECVLCAAPTHPLAGQSVVTRLDLDKHVELSVGDCSDQGADPRLFGGERVCYLPGFEATKQALLAGLGYGWMPSELAGEELRTGTLRELSYAGGSRYRFTPLLVHRRDWPLGRTATRLIALLDTRTAPAFPAGTGAPAPVSWPLPATRQPL